MPPRAGMPSLPAARCTRGRIFASCFRQKRGQRGALDEGLEVGHDVWDVDGEGAEGHRNRRKSVVGRGLRATVVATVSIVVSRGWLVVVGRCALVVGGGWRALVVVRGGCLAPTTVEATASDGLVGAGDGVTDFAAARVEVRGSEGLGLLAVVVGRIGVVLRGLLAGDLTGRHLGQVVIDHIGRGRDRKSVV